MTDRRIRVQVITHPDRRGNPITHYRVYCAGVAVMDFLRYPSKLIKGL